ncbi:MAG: hypothetical protein P4N24_10715 [Acidobacteriota bacterium]|nr:hypothetical protein [Acidobacteriota bacterium]
MSDKRKQSRRREGRKRMDRRVGDRRAGGVPPAPDTPARHDTGKRRRSTDHKTVTRPATPKAAVKVHPKTHHA